MSTKITTPVLIDLPGEALTSENTAGVVLPKGTTAERPASVSVEYLVVAGGGAGAPAGAGGGGGGAGGLRTSFGSNPGGGSTAETNKTIATGTSYTITVGAGGAAITDSSYNTTKNDGEDSVFDDITSTGGGGGSGGNTSGNTGGSGGGGNGGYGLSAPGGAGTTNQGYAGGTRAGSAGGSGGGGAAAVGVGGGTTGDDGGTGGVGLEVNIIGGTGNYYAGGGGGGVHVSGTPGTGGTGGGGSGGDPNGNNGTANTGGGGGGGSTLGLSTSGAGGSGVVILRYSDTYTIVETTSVLTFTTDSSSVANTKITTFTAGTSGVIQFTPIVTPSTGEFRYNTTDKLVEFYNGSAWKQIADEYISGQPSTCVCNFPTTATALYQLEDNTNDTCGSNNATDTTDITYNSSGKFGKSAVFNGTSSYFKLPFSTLGDNPFTISMWLNFDDLASEKFIFSKYPGSGGYGFYCQSPASATTITFTAYNTGATGYSVVTTTSMSTGVWYNYVLTFDFSSSIKAYLNGSQEATTTPSGTFYQNSDTVYIGRYWNGPTYFDGEMDQIRVFPSALTASQVTELYNEVVCT